MSLPTNHTYAIDRTTMEAADAPAGQQVEDHEGLTIGLPINPDADAEYTLYDFATQSTFPMTNDGSSTVAGREVLNYTVTARGPLKDPAIAAGLPPALPKEQIAQIAGLLPPQTRDQITAALPALPNPVPISYTADSTIGLSADATLGTPVDGTLKQQVIANISVNGEEVALMPVLALDTTLDEESVAAAADTASSTSMLLSLISLWIPLALLLVGLALIAWGALRRKPAASTTGEPTRADADTPVSS
ncbi:UNVERIFIED_ORG: Protein of unknown function (DUF3068) [Gordonia westfalica J30]